MLMRRGRSPPDAYPWTRRATALVLRRTHVLAPVRRYEPRVEAAVTQVIHEPGREVVALAVDRAGGQPERVVFTYVR